jgi:hypothetical protein
MWRMMQKQTRPIRSALVATFLAVTAMMPAQMTTTSQAAGSAATTVLNREQATAILPPTVFFRGQAAPVQGRNSAGLRLPDGKLVLFAVVDTSGYSSALQQTYQAYLLTEVPLTIGDQALAPGAYGFGFIASDKMEIMDIGGNELLRTGTTRDATLTRPTPLQLLPDAASPSRFRLYLGRSYVSFAAVPHGAGVK